LLINLTTADVVGQLLLSSSTLAEGLQRVARFFALLTPSFRMQTTAVDGGMHRLLCEPSVPLPYDMAIQGLETLAVTLHRLMLFLLQEKSVPVALEASWAAPPHAARYRELKGLKPRFGTSHHPQFVMTLIDGYFPSQSDLASLLQISAKTLTRHLAREGRTYRSLAMEVRHQRSRDLLVNSTHSLAEIAQTLGYSDAANFGRAFRMIEGITPGEYRQVAAR